MFTVIVLCLMSVARDCPSEQEKSLERLISAIQDYDLPTVHSILEKGIVLNVLGSAGTTPLIASIEANSPQLAKELVANGADPNLPDYTRTSPLMHAAWNCQTDLVHFLREHAARVDPKNKDGETALMMAAWACKDGQTVRLLLQVGAAVNEKTNSGNTALMYAAYNGDLDAVKALVAAGADLNARNAEGKTALGMAETYGMGKQGLHRRVADFLRIVSTQKKKQ